MRLVCANLNGVRAAARRGGLEWLAASEPDVVCLQEVRANGDQFREALKGTRLADFSCAHAPATRPGWSGVAILSLREPTDLRVAPAPLDAGEFVDTGRWLEADFAGDQGQFTVVSVYVPKGEAETEKQEAKYRFLDLMSERLRALAGLAHPVFVAGDFNIAHREIDLRNWRGNRGHSGFLEPERAQVSGWLSDGWVDLGRRLFGPDVPGPYTWWTWRGQAFTRDTGWRIDYVLGNGPAAAAARAYSVGRAESYGERWSDHAPLVLDVDL